MNGRSVDGERPFSGRGEGGRVKSGTSLYAGGTYTVCPIDIRDTKFLPKSKIKNQEPRTKNQEPSTEHKHKNQERAPSTESKQAPDGSIRAVGRDVGEN